MKVSVNVNDLVKVKLTTKGLLILGQYYMELGKFPLPSEGCDENGFLQVELWKLMNIFGQELSMGSPYQLFEKNELIFETRT